MPPICLPNKLSPFIFFYLLVRERERERASRRACMGEGQRERERIPSRLHAVGTEPNVGLDPTNHEFVS